MKILTYNIHHWDGHRGQRDISQLAEVIRSSEADIVSLNEAVHPVRRHGEIETPLAQLADAVGMDWVFGSSGRHIEGRDWRGTVGNAVLSKHQISGQINHLLPRLPGTQQRSALFVQLVIQEMNFPFTFWATHLDHALEPVRLRQLRGLLHQTRHLEYPHVIAGDFNTHTPGKHRWVPAVVSELHSAGYVDAFSVVGHGTGATFPARYPIFRIDYAFVPLRWAGQLKHAEVLNTPLTRVASDHLPLLLDWDIAECYVH